MNKEIRKCNCGCGEAVAGKANYRPGHDARHAGQTGRAAVEAFDAGQGHWDSKEFYMHLPSDALHDKALRVARKIIEGRARKEAQGRAKGSQNLDSLKGSRRSAATGGNLAQVQAKVGRWVYEGVVVGDNTFVYTDKQGNRQEAISFLVVA
jgi:hypothetical protein